jgi:hypothetical protein
LLRSEKLTDARLPCKWRAQPPPWRRGQSGSAGPSRSPLKRAPNA